MKKIILFAATCAVFAACNITDIDNTAPSEGNTFEKGQKVTLTVGTTSTNTKTVGILNTTTQGVDFIWENGDKIKITVGGNSSEFTLISGAGERIATFEGTMPGSGSSYDVQYPYAGLDVSALANQTYYSTAAIPHNMMLATASGCSGTSFTLKPQYAALRLNVSGLSPIGSIVVTTKENPAKTYVLDCKGPGNTGTEPSKTDTPKPFFVVVPAGTYGFTVSVKNVSGAELNSCTTTSDKTITKGKVLNMSPLGYPGTDDPPVKIGDDIWAPVDCGFDEEYPYGRLYQWGRKYGQGYKDSDYQDDDYPGKSGGSQFSIKLSSGLSTHPDGDSYNGNFYWNQYSWYKGGGSGAPAANDLWGPNKTAYDPCPAGWRVATLAEMRKLLGKHTGGDLQDGRGSYAGMKGKYFDGSTTEIPTSGVFLPASGYRNNWDGKASLRGTYGYYWTSTVSTAYEDYATFLYFDNTMAGTDSNSRARAYPVRCIQE